LRKLINDPAVEVIPPSARGRPASPPSKLETDMFRSLEISQAKVFPGVPTLPMMLTGATDSAQLRAKGVQAYGLGSVAGDKERASVHGNDERISVEGLGKLSSTSIGPLLKSLRRSRVDGIRWLSARRSIES